AIFNQLFHSRLNNRILSYLHFGCSMVELTLSWNTKMTYRLPDWEISRSGSRAANSKQISIHQVTQPGDPGHAPGIVAEDGEIAHRNTGLYGADKGRKILIPAHFFLPPGQIVGVDIPVQGFFTAR
ncbi:MAG: hypothetical protein GY862_04435, partial [Gammaproteobacteria bacterium]|nr:hypothetical protein [Gammaproteobacteria bacterium]